MADGEHQQCEGLYRQQRKQTMEETTVEETTKEYKTVKRKVKETKKKVHRVKGESFLLSICTPKKKKWRKKSKS